MMRARVLRRVIPLLIVSAMSASLLVATASAGGHRTLRLVHRDPATVRGTGFRPRAVVRVTFAAGRNYVSRTRASSTGTFTVRFSTVVDRCTAWTVTAIQGAAAPVVLHGPEPECAPA